MATRLLNGPRRYVQDTTSTCSTIDSRTSSIKSIPNTSPPYSHVEADPVITPSPFSYNAKTTPFQATANDVHHPNNVSQGELNYTTSDRRRSSKTKGFDTDKLPRPDIHADTSYAPPNFVTMQYYNPPPSYSNFTTVDNGNAGPRFIRSALYKVPTEESMLNNLHIPFGFITQPLADPTAGEEIVQMVDAGEQGPLRCQKCRAYVNPHWIFIQGGRTGTCNLCKHQNPLPKDLVCPLDAQGLRTDRLARPELSKGVYEFVAPQTYHTRKAVISNIIICVEAGTVCYNTGIFHQAMSSILSLLDFIPCPELTNICVMTYDTGINFFRVPDDLSKDISVVHMPESETPFLPLPKKSLFFNLKTEREKVGYLIEKVIKFYETNNRLQQKGVTTTCLGTALSNCHQILLQDGGKVLLFATQPPAIGVGKIKRRDDFKIMGTDKERNLYVSQSEDYNEWAKEWLNRKISLDLFCFAQEYFDLTTIGQICNLTGGNIYHYPSYHLGHDGERLHYDLSRNLTRSIGYDAVMTVRVSKGLTFMNYVLPNGIRPMPELQFSAIDADTVINFCLKHEEKLKDETIGLQLAVLYTNMYGQRVIRIINFNVNTSHELPVIFKSADVETVAQLIVKKNIINITHTSVPKVRKELIDNLASIFLSYKVHCSPSTPPTQLVFPEQLQLLPIFVLAALKSNILKTIGDLRPDDRFYDLHRFLKMPVNVLSNLWYIKIFPLHTIYDDNEYGAGNIADEKVILGSNLPATDEKLDNNGIYLMDNNDTIFIYVKKNADPYLLQELFGVESFHEVSGCYGLTDNPDSYYLMRVNNIIEQLRRNKNASYQPVRIVTEKDPYESSLLNLLVEDEKLEESYKNFLCNVHKLIKEKL